MKKIILIFAVTVAVIVVFFGEKDRFITALVTSAAKRVTGFSCHISRLSFGIMKPKITIATLALRNPRDFPDRDFMTVSSFTGDLQRGSCLRRNPHFLKATLIIDDIVVVKSKDGRLNLDDLRFFFQKEYPETMRLSIDTLHVSIKKVFYKDYSQGAKPITEVYNVGIQGEVFSDIKSAEQLFAVILVTAFKPTTIHAAALENAAHFLGTPYFLKRLGAVLSGKIITEDYFDTGFDRAYKISRDVLMKNAILRKEDSAAGLLQGRTQDGTVITIRLTGVNDKTVKISVSARQLLVSQPKAAAAVLFQISGRLKVL